MTDKPTNIPAVTTDLYNLLQPLQPDERRRVIKAALAMLGDDTPVVDRSAEKASEADVDGASDLPTKARQWMKQHAVTQEHWTMSSTSRMAAPKWSRTRHRARA